MFIYSWMRCISCFSYFFVLLLHQKTRQCNQSRPKCKSPKLFSPKLKPSLQKTFISLHMYFHEHISPCEQEEPYTIQKNKTGSWGQFGRRCRYLHFCNLCLRQFTWVICCAQEERDGMVPQEGFLCVFSVLSSQTALPTQSQSHRK